MPKNISAEEITPEQASILVNLPRQLGNDIEVSIGKFGPYIKHNGKFTSLKGDDNIFNITLERAQELLQGAPTKQAGKVLGLNPKDNTEISLNFGPYGPYLKNGKTNYKLPTEFKGKEPSLEEALSIIENTKKK